MSHCRRRLRQRRLYESVVAHNYLRNISLDGTHADTPLSIFTTPGLPPSSLHHRRVAGTSDVAPTLVAFSLGISHEESVPDDEERRLTIGDGASDVPLIQKQPSSPVLPERSSLDKNLLQQEVDQLERRSISSLSSFGGGDGRRYSNADDSDSVKQQRHRKAMGARRKLSMKSQRLKDGILNKIGSFLASTNESQTTTNIDEEKTDENNDLPNYNVSHSPSKGEIKFMKSLKKVAPRDERTDREKYQSSGSLERLGIRPIELAPSQEVSYRELLLSPRGTAGHLPQTVRSCLLPRPHGYTTTAVSSQRYYVSEEHPPHAQQHSPPPVTTSSFLLPSQQSAPPNRSPIPRVSRASSCEPTRRPEAFSFDDIAEELVDHEDAFDQTDALSRTYAAGDVTTERYHVATQPTYFYDPHVTYDPEFGVGQHKTTLRFPGYVTSIIEYMDKNELKKQINEKFKRKYPNVQITFSKLKSIKRELRLISLEAHLETMVLASSYVFFEKLVFKAQVNKTNRKLVAGACLLLAAKLNDVRGERLTSLIAHIESRLRVGRKELFAYELPAAIALEFALNAPDWELHAHYHRLMPLIGAATRTLAAVASTTAVSPPGGLPAAAIASMLPQA